MAIRCMLVMHDGPSRRVGASGLLVGRQEDCDIVVPDPATSRRHALVRTTGDGAEIVPLGRGTIEVNGKSHDKPCPLGDGDRLTFPGLSLQVQLVVEPDTAPRFALARERGGTFGLAKVPFVIGGGANDDLMIAEWPPAALVFHIVNGQLAVELRKGEAAHDGEPLAHGELQPLEIGDRITCRGETITILGGRQHIVSTDVSRDELFPTRVRIELLPRGGLAVFTMPSGEHTVFLADKRFDLLMALLQPPGGYIAGEFVNDDTVRTIVWPRNAGVGRQELNTLISRCRRDLVDAGLNGAKLIQRAPGGGGTRLVLARDAMIEVKQ